MRPHLAGLNDEHVDQATDLYSLRISGHLGPTALSAFPLMVAQLKGNDTWLTGVLDRFALYGVLAEIEALGLDLVELRRLIPRRNQATRATDFCIGRRHFEERRGPSGTPKPVGGDDPRHGTRT